MMGFRKAYKEYRAIIIFNCNKHGLSDDPEQYADEKINELSLAELLNEIESLADYLDETTNEEAA